MTFYVYMILNICNGKIYIGETNRPKRRWYEHNLTSFSENINYRSDLHLYNSIRKYGEENFIFNAFQAFKIKQEALDAEVYYTLYYESYKRENGYNFKIGGGYDSSGKVVSEETKEKQRKAVTGKKRTPETIAKTSGENNYNVKLTNAQVTEIRINYNREIHTFHQLAKKYNISEQTVCKIIYNIARYNSNYIPPEHIRSKLSMKDAVEIRKLYNKENYTIQQLSKIYNKKEICINKIIYNKCFYDDNYQLPAPIKIPRRKLTKEQVVEIRKLYELGSTMSDIAQIFNVTSSNICCIINYETWKDI